MWIAVLNEQGKKKWNILKNTDENKVEGIIFIPRTQLRAFEDHGIYDYDSIHLTGGENIIAANKVQMLALLKKTGEHSLVEVNALMWNIRSLNNSTKRGILAQLLITRKIDIAFIQEIFLSKDGRLYIRGWKVIRSDRVSRRKGTLILVKDQLVTRTTKVMCDPMGRFMKVRMTDERTGTSRTLVPVYLEPTETIDEQTIPDSILISDVIGSDMNNMDSGLNRIDVYHIRELRKVDIVDHERAISDHLTIIGRIKIPATSKTVRKKRCVQAK